MTGSDQSDVGVEEAGDFVRRHPGLLTLGRSGWVAKGVVYALTGVLALIVAAGRRSSDSEASQTGAIARIAQNPLGVVALAIIAAGFVIFAGWCVVTVLLPADSDLEGWLKRVGFSLSAVVYLLLAWTAVSFATDPGQPAGKQDSRIESFSRSLMGHDGGRIAVGVVGVVVVVIAGAFLWRAIDASFTAQLAPGGLGTISQDLLVVLGRIGWVGRSVMMALIGFFLVRAAVLFNPDDAQGLDGSLRKAAATGWGSVLVVVVGIGLLVYGTFCGLSAPKRRLVGADG